MELQNKSVIVTGSGRGIGEYIAKRLAREGANIVVTGRTTKDIEKEGIPMLGAYCASKFAVIGLTESAAAEVNNINVKIVALCPGSVDTGMFKRLFPGEKADLKPDEVAQKVADICTNPEKYRQGQSIELY